MAYWLFCDFWVDVQFPTVKASDHSVAEIMIRPATRDELVLVHISHAVEGLMPCTEYSILEMLKWLQTQALTNRYRPSIH